MSLGEHPLDDFETEKSRNDTGACSLWMLRGALNAGASIQEAYLTVAAYYCGMFCAMDMSGEIEPEERDDE